MDLQGNPGRSRPRLSAAERVAAANRCTASLGKRLGRCPADAVAEYAQLQVFDPPRLVWMKRCADHPLSNHHGVRPFNPNAAELSTSPHG